MSLEVVGWIGSVAFALCGAPQAMKSYKEGHSHGISWGLLSLWFIGEVCTLIYVIPKSHLPLIFNYLGNLFFVAIIIYYKIYPKHRGGDLYDMRKYKEKKK